MSAQPSAIGALRSRSFALVWSAGGVSGFGDKITLIALAYASWSLTQSAFVTSLSVVIATVPNALFGLLAGALADALGRRRTMIACDLLRVVLVGAIPVSFALGPPLAFVSLLVFLASVCGAVFKPARLSVLPDVLGGNDLGAGNSLVVSSDRLVEIVGALIAGVIVAAIAVGAVVAAGVMPALMARARKGRLLIIGFAANGLVLVLLAQSPSFGVLVLLFMFFGMTNVMFLVPNLTIAQEATPAPLRARVFGARIALLNLSRSSS